MVAWIKKVANAVRSGMSFWGMVGQLTISIVGGLIAAGLLGLFSSIPILFRADTILSGLAQAVEAAQRWQIALVGVFGVSTVLIAANQIIRAIRRRDEEIREHDRRALAAALIGEIAAIGDAFAYRYTCVKNERTSGLPPLPPMPDFTIYRANADHLGLLGSAHALRVATLYTGCAEVASMYEGTIKPSLCGENGMAANNFSRRVHLCFQAIGKLAPVAECSEKEILAIQNFLQIDSIPDPDRSIPKASSDSDEAPHPPTSSTG